MWTKMKNGSLPIKAITITSIVSKYAPDTSLGINLPYVVQPR